MTLTQFLSWCDEQEAAGNWIECRAMAFAQDVIGRELTAEERKRYEVARLWRQNLNPTENRRLIALSRPKPRRTYYTDVDRLRDVDRLIFERELQRLRNYKGVTV